MFTKILIANRGEIACRVIDTARRMGIATVAVYSDADKKARHVRMADEAVRIGPAASRDSYLRGDVILQAAKETGAQAIHPGYGFLSENEDFAKSCAKAGVVFIGPTPEAIDAMGLKDKAKDIMAKAGVPVVPGYMGAKQDVATLQRESTAVGYPVLIKAVAGGGGKGMRLVHEEKDFAAALESCKREATSSFGNDHVMVEKCITRPRHVEVQVFGDSHGNAVYLYERDCSLQRRHQKVVEEAPAPGIPDSVRRKLGEAAVKAIKAIKYQNAGTIEFIMDSQSYEFFFMEMNTRLQVEHPVTEMITGLDLVEWQLRIAAGETLPLAQKDIQCVGHAFEVRLYAEDPAHDFLPQTGTLSCFLHPHNARVDTGVEEDDAVSIHYDPMIAKLIVHADTREDAVKAMQEALAETVLTGLVTNQEYLSHIFHQQNFVSGEVDTGFLARHEKDLLPENYGLAGPEDLAQAALLWAGEQGEDEEFTDLWDRQDNWRLNGAFSKTMALMNRGQHHAVTLRGTVDGYEAVIDGKRVAMTPLSATTIVENDRDITVFRNGQVIHVHHYIPGEDSEDGAGEGRIIAPMPGKIITVMVEKGDAVKKDQPILVMEAMKMEMTIRAGCEGVIDELPVAAGQQVSDGALLVSIEKKEAA